MAKKKTIHRGVYRGGNLKAGAEGLKLPRVGAKVVFDPNGERYELSGRGGYTSAFDGAYIPKGEVSEVFAEWRAEIRVWGDVPGRRRTYWGTRKKSK